MAAPTPIIAWRSLSHLYSHKYGQRYMEEATFTEEQIVEVREKRMRWRCSHPDGNKIGAVYGL